MAQEIERKYLVAGDQWLNLPVAAVKTITQGNLRAEAAVFISCKDDVLSLRLEQNGKEIRIKKHLDGDEKNFANVTKMPNYDTQSGRFMLDDLTVFRFRTSEQDDGNRAFITVKRFTGDPEINDEYEISIPFNEVSQALSSDFCEGFVSKRRHVVPFEGQNWEVDVFQGNLEGLVLAELEVVDKTVFETLKPLPGASEDVTTMEGISNRDLGQNGIPPVLKQRLGL